MKTAAAAAMMLGLMTPADAVAEPKVLSDVELDAITAAGVLVDVNSFAVAFGDVARARTDANTFALSGTTYELGFGLTVGEALACCGEESDVAVGSTVLGLGDNVHGATHGFNYDGPFSAYGLSLGFVLAISFNQHWQEMIQEQHLAMIAELHSALADAGSQVRAAMPDLILPND